MNTLIKSIISYLEPALAELFAKFKLKSPIVAAIVLLILGTCNIIANFGEQIGLPIFSQGLVSTIISVGSLVFGYLIQSKTTAILAKAEEQKRLQTTVEPEALNNTDYPLNKIEEAPQPGSINDYINQ